MVAFSNTNHPKYLVLHVINIVSSFMKFTISATHPMYQHYKVTASLAMFQGYPMLSRKPCQVESSQSKKLQWLYLAKIMYTASFTFSLFLFTLSRIYVTYILFCVSKCLTKKVKIKKPNNNNKIQIQRSFSFVLMVLG